MCRGTVREGLKKVHRNGGYYRNRRAEGDERLWVEQFVCVVCGQTFTVLPDDMLPYRPIEVGKAEAWLDAEYGISGHHPTVTEKEKGCLNRLVCNYAAHTPSLIQKLGQMVFAIRSSAGQLWKQLRRSDGLSDILRMLFEKFKISLAGDYRCLRRSKPLRA